MGKTAAIVQALTEEADEYVGQASGRIRTTMELAQYQGQTLYFVVVEASYDHKLNDYIPSSNTRLHLRRADYFVKNNGGGGLKRFVPRQEIIGNCGLYVVEQGHEDYLRWMAVNVRVYNVQKSSGLYRYNAVFHRLEDAERYRLWVRMLHDPAHGWGPSSGYDRSRYMGILHLDSSFIMAKNPSTK